MGRKSSEKLCPHLRAAKKGKTSHASLCDHDPARSRETDHALCWIYSLSLAHLLASTNEQSRKEAAPKYWLSAPLILHGELYHQLSSGDGQLH